MSFFLSRVLIHRAALIRASFGCCEKLFCEACSYANRVFCRTLQRVGEHCAPRLFLIHTANLRNDFRFLLSHINSSTATCRMISGMSCKISRNFQANAKIRKTFMICMDFMRLLMPPTTLTVMRMPQTLVPFWRPERPPHSTFACLAGCPSHRRFIFFTYCHSCQI